MEGNIRAGRQIRLLGSRRPRLFRCRRPGCSTARLHHQRKYTRKTERVRCGPVCPGERGYGLRGQSGLALQANASGFTRVTRTGVALRPTTLGDGHVNVAAPSEQEFEQEDTAKTKRF